VLFQYYQKIHFILEKITSGIVVYIIILDDLAKFPFGLAALFSIPLVISTAVGIFVYLRKTKE